MIRPGHPARAGPDRPLRRSRSLRAGATLPRSRRISRNWADRLFAAGHCRSWPRFASSVSMTRLGGPRPFRAYQPSPATPAVARHRAASAGSGRTGSAPASTDPAGVPRSASTQRKLFGKPCVPAHRGPAIWARGLGDPTAQLARFRGVQASRHWPRTGFFLTAQKIGQFPRPRAARIHPGLRKGDGRRPVTLGLEGGARRTRTSNNCDEATARFSRDSLPGREKAQDRIACRDPVALSDEAGPATTAALGVLDRLPGCRSTSIRPFAITAPDSSLSTAHAPNPPSSSDIATNPVRSGRLTDHARDRSDPGVMSPLMTRHPAPRPAGCRRNSPAFSARPRAWGRTWSAHRPTAPEAARIRGSPTGDAP